MKLIVEFEEGADTEAMLEKLRQTRGVIEVKRVEPEAKETTKAPARPPKR